MATPSPNGLMLLNSLLIRTSKRISLKIPLIADGICKLKNCQSTPTTLVLS